MQQEGGSENIPRSFKAEFWFSSENKVMVYMRSMKLKKRFVFGVYSRAERTRGGEREGFLIFV